ncbi:MAG: hypothetical protein RBU37_02640 [Myxococcota bacterium]|jgi:23S rRNA (uracil1939-C5)-methyltransferase|nr:hypothetical protein [Myxococcota bacterium]
MTEKRSGRHRLRIESLDEELCGVGELQSKGHSWALSVPGGVPGDLLDVEVQHYSPHSRRAWGKLVERLERSEHWREPPCAHAAPCRGRCGGCAGMHLSTQLLAQHKVRMLETALQEQGLEAPTKLELKSAGPRLGYRNRANYVLEGSRLGSYAPRSHVFADMDGCLIVREVIRDCARLLQERLKPSSLPQRIRYLGLCASSELPGCALELIFAEPPDAETLNAVCARLEVGQEGSPFLGLSYSMNQSDGNALRVEQGTHCAGARSVFERFGDVLLERTNSSFSQVNSEVAAAMYSMATEWIDSSGLLWDLFCGIGAFGLCVGAKGRVFGAEWNEAALELARRNAERLGVKACFETWDLHQSWPSWPPAEVVLVNPPRRGLERHLLERLAALPSALLYMSCNPLSFARDARILSENGRVMSRLATFDMMPQTAHSELLAYFPASAPQP